MCEMCIRVLVCECGNANAMISCLEDEVPYVSCSISVRYVLRREGSSSTSVGEGWGEMVRRDSASFRVIAVPSGSG
jgi:hypothetical protein